MERAAPWLLIVAWVTTLVGNVIVFDSCGADCGDEGGRLAFFLLALLSPAAVLAVRRLQRGALGRLARWLTKALAVAYFAFAALMYAWPEFALPMVVVAVACWRL